MNIPWLGWFFQGAWRSAFVFGGVAGGDVFFLFPKDEMKCWEAKKMAGNSKTKTSTSSGPWWNSLKFIVCVFFLFSFYYCKTSTFSRKRTWFFSTDFGPHFRKDLKNTKIQPTEVRWIFRGRAAFIAPMRCGATWHRVRPLFRASATWDGALPCALRRHPWRYQPFETWNGREGRDGLASVGSLNGRNPKTPKKTRQRKGRRSETPLKEKRKKPGYNRKQKRIKKIDLFVPKLSFFQVNSCCFFLGPGWPRKPGKESFPPKVVPMFWTWFQFPPKSLQKLGAFVECRDFFLKCQKFLFGGLAIFRNSKLQASHVQLIQDEAGVWKAQLLDLCHVAGKKHDTPAKINKCPLKRDHLQL